MRKLLKELFSDGIMPNPSSNMQVSAGSGMNVTVQPGFAMCNGCMKLEEAQRTLAIQSSSAAYDRIDTVVLRLDDNIDKRICDFYIVQGVPATNPVRPALTRTESVWEIGLADLFIAKNSTGISNQRITDTRYETVRCGVVSSISKFDTTTLYQQIQNDLKAFKVEEQAEFLKWFDNAKNQLSTDAAGNLQNQIDAEIEARKEADATEKESRINGDNAIWYDLARSWKKITTTVNKVVAGGGTTIRPVYKSALLDGEYVEVPADLTMVNAFTEEEQLILAKGYYKVTEPYSFTSSGTTYYTGTFTAVSPTTGMMLVKQNYSIENYDGSLIEFNSNVVTKFGTGQHVFNTYVKVLTEITKTQVIFSVDSTLNGYLNITPLGGKTYPIRVKNGQATPMTTISASDYCFITGTLC